MPRVTAGSTDDDKDLDAPTDRVLVDTERLEDAASSVRLQFNTWWNIMHNNENKQNHKAQTPTSLHLLVNSRLSLKLQSTT